MNSLMIFIWVIGWVIASSAYITEVMYYKPPSFWHLVTVVVFAAVWPIYIGIGLAIKE